MIKPLYYRLYESRAQKRLISAGTFSSERGLGRVMDKAHDLGGVYAEIRPTEFGGVIGEIVFTPFSLMSGVMFSLGHSMRVGRQYVYTPVLIARTAIRLADAVGVFGAWGGRFIPEPLQDGSENAMLSVAVTQTDKNGTPHTVQRIISAPRYLLENPLKFVNPATGIIAGGLNGTLISALYGDGDGAPFAVWDSHPVNARGDVMLKSGWRVIVSGEFRHFTRLVVALWLVGLTK